MDRMGNTPDAWEDLEGDVCPSSSRIGPQDFTMSPHRNRDGLGSPNNEEPHDVNFMIRSTYMDIKAIKATLEDLSQHREDHNVRLVRLEEGRSGAVWLSRTAIGAAIGAVVVTVWHKIVGTPPSN